jgi:UDP-4-amino-4,6-dideoxy-N-acetyl-beta-L-altrosamine transaminase
MSDLAIHGGRPVRNDLLPYGHQAIDEDDIEAVVKILQSEWITTGPTVREFEEAFAAYVGARHAVSFSSGTAALHGTAFAAGLGPGTEAITTPMTFCATVNCIVYQGGTPIFADVCNDTMNIDPDEVVHYITRNTKAILPVDFAGHPADLDAMLQIADRHNLVVIEDASHALGAEYKRRRVGSISHMTVFSFHPVKHVTTGEGGMVTTDDSELATRLQLFRNHGIDNDARKRQTAGHWYYEMVALGYNYRLTDIASALGLTQLRKLDGNLSRRRRIARRYHDAFAGLPGIMPPVEYPDVRSAWHLYPIRLHLPALRFTRAEVFFALRAENIGVNVHYIPVHYHPYYRERFGYKEGEYLRAEACYESLISLPMFHGMTDEDVQDVIAAVVKVMEHCQR